MPICDVKYSVGYQFYIASHHILHLLIGVDIDAQFVADGAVCIIIHLHQCHHCAVVLSLTASKKHFNSEISSAQCRLIQYGDSIIDSIKLHTVVAKFTHCTHLHTTFCDNSAGLTLHTHRCGSLHTS